VLQPHALRMCVKVHTCTSTQFTRKTGAQPRGALALLGRTLQQQQQQQRCHPKPMPTSPPLSLVVNMSLRGSSDPCSHGITVVIIIIIIIIIIIMHHHASSSCIIPQPPPPHSHTPAPCTLHACQPPCRTAQHLPVQAQA